MKDTAKANLALNEDDFEEEEIKSLSMFYQQSFLKDSNNINGFKYTIQEYLIKGLEEYLSSADLPRSNKVSLIKTITRLKERHEAYENFLSNKEVALTKEQVERFGKKMESAGMSFSISKKQ